ncbi:RNA polymerase subunit sigma-24 [Planctomycetota bacterium]|nr:RNA polymerase subunit sigma-24 [Planctomycetota bacterium]
MSAFADTRWSQVRRLGADSPSGRAALGWLCEAAWEPLCRHAQRRGLDRHAAEDAVQAFMARILERGLGSPDPDRGRFRSWLIAAFWHFLADRADSQRAAKRGGGQIAQTLSSVGEVPAADPDFDRDWARSVLRRTLDRLAAEQADAQRFVVLRPFLSANPEADAYAAAAARLDLPSGAVRVAVHRLRKRFAELLRSEVAETLADSDPGTLDGELKVLAAALAESRSPDDHRDAPASTAGR